MLLADFGVFAELNQVFQEFFPNDPPARMTMATPLPGEVLISMECVALEARAWLGVKAGPRPPRFSSQRRSSGFRRPRPA